MAAGYLLGNSGAALGEGHSPVSLPRSGGEGCVDQALGTLPLGFTSASRREAATKKPWESEQAGLEG
ncbi:hypothetical protein FACS1894163_11900 [Spirochaetia bacterium]|nr:hypothetical protein FACS1894163_11900 [Spirochaetia bacterium]